MENLSKKIIKNSQKKKLLKKRRQRNYNFEIITTYFNFILFIFSCIAFFSPYNLYNYIQKLLFEQNTMTTVFGSNPENINQKSFFNFLAFLYIFNFITIGFLLIFMLLMIIKKRVHVSHIEKLILCGFLIINILLDTIIFIMNPKTIVIENNVEPENISFVYPLILPCCTFILATLYFLTKDSIQKLYDKNFSVHCHLGKLKKKICKEKMKSSS